MLEGLKRCSLGGGGGQSLKGFCSACSCRRRSRGTCAPLVDAQTLRARGSRAASPGTVPGWAARTRPGTLGPSGGMRAGTCGPGAGMGACGGARLRVGAGRRQVLRDLAASVRLRRGKTRTTTRTD